MKLREVRIKNFRCLVDIIVPLEDNTVLIGENNSGKTAFLDALRIAMSKSVYPRNLPFGEYDYHMSKADDSPQTSEGIEIELWFREDRTDDWPDSLIQALNNIIQTDPIKDIDSIGLLVKSKFDLKNSEFKVDYNFIDLYGQVLSGKGADARNYNLFQNYIRFFYLSPLRDSGKEFSPRSQFWGQILKDLKISEDRRSEITDMLKRINETILNEDPRLKSVISTLENTQRVMELDEGQKTSIQAMPLKPWDLMAKSEVYIKPRGGEVEFPLERHGQGTQSLAVLFVFQAYIDILLKPSFKAETEAILALEELESHLHPHATRSLAQNLSKIQSQKILTSHSPYFIQEIPFKQIRLFRKSGCESKVLFIKQSFSIKLPTNKKLEDYCMKNKKFALEHCISEQEKCLLTVKGMIDEDEYRKLIKLCQQDKEAIDALKKLKDESRLYLSDDDLSKLDTYAKRIRGEVLFARGWLLCEGQSEYLILRFFSNILGKPFDKSGISVIDFQNNGSPGSFVGLAEIFEIPWVMMCDNDGQGKDFIGQVKKRGLTDDEIGKQVRLLPNDGYDLEMYLLNSGFLSEYLQILKEENKQLNCKEGEAGFLDEIAKILRSNKTGYTIALIDKLYNNECDISRIPIFFKDIIDKITEKVH